MICDINIFLAGLDFAFLGLYASAGIAGPIICNHLYKTDTDTLIESNELILIFKPILIIQNNPIIQLNNIMN